MFYIKPKLNYNESLLWLCEMPWKLQCYFIILHYCFIHIDSKDRAMIQTIHEVMYFKPLLCISASQCSLA